MENYKSYDDLPITLTAEDISRFLNISKCSCYALFKRKDFPTIRIGKRVLVGRDRFIEWLERQTKEVSQ